MDYPDNFDTPVFPAGKRIAVSRVMAIGSMIAFLIIVFLCGMLFWSARSMRVDPLIVSINHTTGAWDIVGHSHGQTDMTASQSLQESVAINFAKSWFFISADDAQNNARWADCDRTAVCMSENFSPRANDCAIYCAASDNVFSAFVYDVVPDYQARAAAGAVWMLDSASTDITALTPIDERGGTWQIMATVLTDTGAMDVVAFATVARDVNTYPATMGYYVAAFNAYRIK